MAPLAVPPDGRSGRERPLADCDAVEGADTAEESRRQGATGTYLSAQLALIAATPTVDEVIERIGRRAKGRVSRTSAVAALQDERARR